MRLAPPDSRQRRILNAVLLPLLMVLSVLTLLLAYTTFAYGGHAHGMRLVYLLIIVATYAALWQLNRKGKTKLAAVIFLGTFYLALVHGTAEWGVSLPIGLLSFALLSTMAGILLSPRAGLVAAAASAIAILVIGFNEHAAGVLPAWKQVVVQRTDVIAYSVMVLFAAYFSWLSNREIERSLAVARSSEDALRAERDNLEAAVEERTRAWREAELERSSELSRLAEFGKRSAMMLHDLMSPLTAVALSMHDIGKDGGSAGLGNEAKERIDAAVRAANRMGDHIASVRRQLSHRGNAEDFDGAEELREAVRIHTRSAAENGVQVSLDAVALPLHGEPLKFYQAFSNLIGNAIESYGNGPVRERRVTIEAGIEGLETVILVRDNGTGMDEDRRRRIFDPFFTTKEDGIGLGLPIAKEIINDGFGGTIECESVIGEGTAFVVRIPLRS